MNQLTLREKLYAYPRVILNQIKIDLKYEWILLTTPKDSDTILIKAWRKTASFKDRVATHCFHFKQNPKTLYELSLFTLINHKPMSSERRNELIQFFKDSFHKFR